MREKERQREGDREGDIEGCREIYIESDRERHIQT